MKMKQLDNKTAGRLFKRAKFIAKQKNMGDFSEDLAQDVLKKYLEGKGQKQALDFAIVDSIRDFLGDSRTKNFEEKKAINNMTALHDKKGKLIYDMTSEEIVGEGADFNKIISFLDNSDRAMVVLFYEWGLSLEEIGRCFGVSESRISQKLKEVQERLKKRVKEF
jgi:RNA polymerase sigma factor (sigma-70 family)